MNYRNTILGISLLVFGWLLLATGEDKSLVLVSKPSKQVDTKSETSINLKAKGNDNFREVRGSSGLEYDISQNSQYSQNQVKSDRTEENYSKSDKAVVRDLEREGRNSEHSLGLMDSSTIQSDHIIAEQLDLMESKFQTESVDEGWSEMAESQIADSISNSSGGYEINGLTCAESICKATFTLGSVNSFDSEYEATAQVGDPMFEIAMAWDGESNFTQDPNTGDITAYFARGETRLVESN